MYSVSNHNQYLVITYINGKDSEAVHPRLIQYCKSTRVTFFKKQLEIIILSEINQKKKGKY